MLERRVGPRATFLAGEWYFQCNLCPRSSQLCHLLVSMVPASMDIVFVLGLPLQLALQEFLKRRSRCWVDGRAWFINSVRSSSSMLAGMAPCIRLHCQPRLNQIKLALVELISLTYTVVSILNHSYIIILYLCSAFLSSLLCIINICRWMYTLSP